MFKQFGNDHLCSIYRTTTKSFLPPLKPTDGCWKKFLRKCKKLILIAEYNPLTFKCFQSCVAIERERKEHVLSGSWIIHPCSTFRLYYEMWMSLIFFLLFLYTPFHAAFAWTHVNIRSIEYFLFPFCWIDIILNFRTGYLLPTKEIEMRPKKIASHYIFGRYFIFDVLSSLPNNHLGSGYDDYTMIVNYLAVLKVVRVDTYFTYFNRTLNFWRLKIFYFRLLIVLILLVHYLSCFRAVFPDIRMYIEGKHDEYVQDRRMGYPGGFIQAYIYNIYHGGSIFLNIEKASDLKFKHWTAVGYTMASYFIGKVFFAFISVIVVQHISKRSSLETKYQAMISQVNAFMKAHNFPQSLQRRMKQYYLYKYGGKYLNEDRINRHISDRLRNEIKYNACRQMMESHSFFAKLSKQMLEKIVSHLKEEIYLPTDNIIKAGIVGDCMYFLSSGTVSVTTVSGREVCHLQDGDYFGEIALIMPNHKTVANVTALEICEVYRLERKGFKKLFESNVHLFKPMKKEAKKRFAQTSDIEERYVKSINVTIV